MASYALLDVVQSGATRSPPSLIGAKAFVLVAQVIRVVDSGDYSSKGSLRANNDRGDGAAHTNHVLD